MSTRMRAANSDLGERTFETLRLKFSKGWSAVVSDVNASVLKNFANFVNGMAILKIALTRLLASYTRYLDIIRLAWRRPPPFCKDLVSTTVIMAEIRAISRDFSSP